MYIFFYKIFSIIIFFTKDICFENELCIYKYIIILCIYIYVYLYTFLKDRYIHVHPMKAGWQSYIQNKHFSVNKFGVSVLFIVTVDPCDDDNSGSRSRNRLPKSNEYSPGN